RLEPLIEALDLGLVFGPEDAVAREGGLLALAGCQNFAPILAIGDAVDQGIAREAAQVAEQAVAGIEISGVDQQQTRVVEERDADDERGDPAGAVQAAD